MEKNSQTQLLGIIERDLVDIKNQLSENAFSGHELLSEQASNIEDLPLAKILLNSASLGNYQSDELIPVAVGLELLRLAAERHYLDIDGQPTSSNLSLVTADYYYARAISLASRLNKGYVVERMVKSIAELAEIEASKEAGVDQDEEPDLLGGDKHVGLFKAAAELGLLMSNRSSDMEDL